MDDLTERILSSELIYDGHLVKLHVETIRLPNGRTGRREVVRHPGAVAMVPLLDSGEVILVRQFRLPAGICITEDDRIFVADSVNKRIQEFRYLAADKGRDES